MIHARWESWKKYRFFSGFKWIITQFHTTMEIENDYKQLNWLRLKQEVYRLGNRYEPKWVWHSRERQRTFAFRKLPRRIYFKCDAYEMIRNPNAGVNIYFSKSSLSSFWAVVLSPGQHRQFPQAIFLAVQFNNRWVWNQREKEIAKVIFGSEHRHSTHALKPPMLIRHEKKKFIRPYRVHDFSPLSFACVDHTVIWHCTTHDPLKRNVGRH